MFHNQTVKVPINGNEIIFMPGVLYYTKKRISECRIHRDVTQSRNSPLQSCFHFTRELRKYVFESSLKHRCNIGNKRNVYLSILRPT